MPQDNNTAKLLDMEGMEVEKIEMDEKEIRLSFHLERKTHVCPDCGTLSDIVHDYRVQRVKDLPIQGKTLVWLYKKRRYRCPCCDKRFYEKNYLLPKWHRITNRTAMYCLDLLKERRSQKDIARSIGVSASTVNRWLGLAEYGRPSKLPEVLSIDEFKGNTDGEKFQCVLTDAKAKRVMDILPSRKQAVIAGYLLKYRERSNVKYIVMDMNKAYLETMKQLFPKAAVVIDKFHVARYCTWAFENVRKRIQKKLPGYDRKYFKRSRRLLLSRMAKLSDKNKAAAEVMLSCSTELTNAYLLKEYFYSFMDSKDSDEARERLKWFKLQASIADIKEYDACLTMLKNWEKYILNAFDCHYSNGYTEGVNNSIKVIKRTGFGYRNFENLRRRIMLVHTAN